MIDFSVFPNWVYKTMMQVISLTQIFVMFPTRSPLGIAFRVAIAVLVGIAAWLVVRRVLVNNPRINRSAKGS